MPAVLYYVRPGDTLSMIARRFGVSVGSITSQNIICNPDLIFPGEVLIIPDPGLELPRAGILPYYVIRPGDTLWCLANAVGTTFGILAANNGIANPNLIFPGQEILAVGERPDPAGMAEIWENLGGWPSCDQIPPISIHGIYYLGTFLWEVSGSTGVPYLLNLLGHPCDIVRIYSVISLGRIAQNGRVRAALTPLINDLSETVRQLVPIALRRIDLGETGRRNVHLTIGQTRLYQAPDLGSPSVTLPYSSEVTALRWYIPSPSGEEGPRGGIQIYDRVMEVSTGRTGFIPRGGFDEIPYI